MPNPTARPEAQEPRTYWIARCAKCGGIDGAFVERATTDPERLEEWKEFGAVERMTERPDPADWCECSYLRHAEALRDGPPVDTPEARTLREIAELPVPQVGETWHHCDGEPVEVLDVRHDGHDHIMAYRWAKDDRVETRTLRSWYGYERPGVRRFSREAPVPVEPDWVHPVHRGEPKPIPPNVKIRGADSGRIEGSDNWRYAPLPHGVPRPDPTSVSERTRRARLWHAEVWREIERIIRGNRPFASAHEGLAIFEEEAEELQAEVRHGTPAGIVLEATQAAAVAVRILTDCGGEPPNGEDGDE